MKFRINLSVGLVLAILIVTFSNVSCSSKNITKERHSRSYRDHDITKPLILTDYLPDLQSRGRVDILRNLAKVKLTELGGVESYAGYLKDEAHSYNHYFWYFPATERPETAPVILYMEGTVRKNMFFSIFTQNGPFSMGSDGRLKRRRESWHNKHHMIYMDNMPGMGFTFTSDRETVDLMAVRISSTLTNALKKFFVIFPSIGRNPFFVAGNYYAWTYLPLLSHSLQNSVARNPYSHSEINFKGIIIANGLVDSNEQLFFGDYLYTTGLIDDNGKRQFDNLARGFASYRDPYKTAEFYKIYEEIIMGEDSLFKRLTGYRHPYNILEDDFHPAFEDYYSSWVTSFEVRRALHIGDYQPYQPLSDTALANWRQCISLNAVIRLRDVFQNHRVLIYTGNLDILCPYPSVERWIGKFSWSNKRTFTVAERLPWHDSNNELAGYIKKGGNIVEVVMINAGHHPCIDQPKRTLQLVERFTHDEL